MSSSDLDTLLTPHPVLDKLSRSPNDGIRAVAVCGYIGVAEDPNRVRIYNSLDIPGYWFEVNRSDILHAAVQSQELQRITIWIQRDARVVRSMPITLFEGGDFSPTFTRDKAPTSMRDTAPVKRDTPLLSLSDSDMIPISKGRLRILLGDEGTAATPGALLMPSSGPSGCKCICKCE